MIIFGKEWNYGKVLRHFVSHFLIFFPGWVLVEGQIAGRHNWVLSWIKKSVDSFFVSTAGGRWSIGWNML